MRNNIKLGLYSLLPVALLAFLNNVIAKLTGNALFPAPPVSVVNMQILSDELRVAIEDATGGSIVARKVRDAKVLAVRDVLRIQRLRTVGVRGQRSGPGRAVSARQTRSLLTW